MHFLPLLVMTGGFEQAPYPIHFDKHSVLT